MLLNSLLPAGNAAVALAPDRFQAWLGSLSSDRPAAAARALASELQRLRNTANIRTRLKLLEAANEIVQKLLRESDRELDRASLPLPPDLQQLFVAVNGLLKALATLYAGITDEISGKWIGFGFNRPLRHALVRAMQFQAHRLGLAYRIYARGSKSAWSELHRLYRLSRMGGFATGKPKSLDTSAEQIYVNALLLAFAEPTKLAPGELERISFYVERHAKFAQIEEAPHSKPPAGQMDACFLIKPKEARAGRSLVRSANAALEPGDLVLRCNRLLAKLQGQIGGLERGIEPIKLGLPLAARQPQFVSMLRNLHRLWSAPPLRRHSRQHFKPRVDIVVGFDALWHFLAGPAFLRRTADPNGLKRQPELSEWAIGNESPSGFSLQYIGGNCGPVCVGELVGLRPREQSTVHVCVTRRVVSNNLQGIELGLQKLAPLAVPTIITPLPRDAEKANKRQSVRAIVVPRLPAHGNALALVVPPKVLEPGLQIRIPREGQEVKLAVAASIEQCPTCEIFSLAETGP